MIKEHPFFNRKCKTLSMVALKDRITDSSQRKIFLVMIGGDAAAYRNEYQKLYNKIDIATCESRADLDLFYIRRLGGRESSF